MRSHHTTQHNVQFKAYEVFISRIFFLVFLDLGRSWVTVYAESKAMDKGKLLYNSGTK